jgi:hypothetical protein
MMILKDMELKKKSQTFNIISNDYKSILQTSGISNLMKKKTFRSFVSSRWFKNNRRFRAHPYFDKNDSDYLVASKKMIKYRNELKENLNELKIPPEYIGDSNFDSLDCVAGSMGKPNHQISPINGDPLLRKYKKIINNEEKRLLNSIMDILFDPKYFELKPQSQNRKSNNGIDPTYPGSYDASDKMFSLMNSFKRDDFIDKLGGYFWFIGLRFQPEKKVRNAFDISGNVKQVNKNFFYSDMANNGEFTYSDGFKKNYQPSTMKARMYSGAPSALTTKGNFIINPAYHSAIKRFPETLFNGDHSYMELRYKNTSLKNLLFLDFKNYDLSIPLEVAKIIAEYFKNLSPELLKNWSNLYLSDQNYFLSDFDGNEKFFLVPNKLGNPSGGPLVKIIGTVFNIFLHLKTLSITKKSEICDFLKWKLNYKAMINSDDTIILCSDTKDYYKRFSEMCLRYDVEVEEQIPGVYSGMTAVDSNSGVRFFPRLITLVGHLEGPERSVDSKPRIFSPVGYNIRLKFHSKNPYFDQVLSLWNKIFESNFKISLNNLWNSAASRLPELPVYNNVFSNLVAMDFDKYYSIPGDVVLDPKLRDRLFIVYPTEFSKAIFDNDLKRALDILNDLTKKEL